MRHDMEWQPPTDSVEETEAFDRIDALLASAGEIKDVSRRRTVELASSPTPPIDRILEAVEKLMLIRLALERDATITATIRASLERVLNDVERLCRDWGFDTARVRVDFTRDDLRNGYGDIKTDVTELIRHFRYDARAWRPARPQRRERRHTTHIRELAIAADRSA